MTEWPSDEPTGVAGGGHRTASGAAVWDVLVSSALLAIVLSEGDGQAP